MSATATATPSREVRDDGSHRARHLGTGKRVTLPADYVAEHVTLGYAATIDLRPRTDRQVRLPHRRRGHPHPPTALRRAHPRPRRKPHLPVHRRSRPAPRPLHQSHPPRHRGRRPHRDAGAATAPKSRPPPPPAKPPTRSPRLGPAADMYYDASMHRRPNSPLRPRAWPSSRHRRSHLPAAHRRPRLAGAARATSP